MFLGTAITGDWSKPVPVRSVDEFKKNFGTYSPDGSITYEYVAGLLSAGLPVLFQRIACEKQSTVEWMNNVPIFTEALKKAECASYTATHGTEPNTVTDMIITEKYGGSYGNQMTVVIRLVNKTYWIDVKYRGAVLEKYKIVTMEGNETVYDRNKKFIDAINAIEFKKVNIDIPVDTNSTDPVEIQKVENYLIPVNPTKQDGSIDEYALTNGSDFDEAMVVDEIPNLIFPKLTDKILYQPKFLTSGGYTDDTGNAIGEAMKNLSEARQDCRALIDLPLGTLMSAQQSTAEAKYAYMQLSGTSIIPSASMCAPWAYMQVGNNQVWMPPSYIFLTVLGDNVSKGGKTYTPKAGYTSGRILNIIKPEFDIGSDICEQWQKSGATNINPIMQLQSGDYIIAGNSTLLRIDEDEVNAFNESSADLAVIEIRRFVYNLASELQYQYNGADAFETFSMKTSNFLNRMASDGTVTDYSIANVSTDDNPRTLKIQLNVWVAPTIKAIEIYLNVSYGSVTMSSGGEE